MTRRSAAAALIVFGLFAAWVLFIALPRWYSRKASAVAVSSAPSAAAPAAAVRKITATLFYVANDGLTLTPVQREVSFGASPAEQARAIIEAQLAPAVAPQLSAIPTGVALRDVFITERGDAFVDLSAALSARHPGGSIDEILTVYTLVNALTVNLPAIQRVQILIEGKEVDTLAGHVDLRHPLAKSMDWIVHDTH
jgi:spore germination protein GerM